MKYLNLSRRKKKEKWKKKKRNYNKEHWKLQAVCVMLQFMVLHQEMYWNLKKKKQFC